MELEDTDIVVARDFLNYIINIFRKEKIESPRQEAEILLLETLGIEKIDLYLKTIEISRQYRSKLNELIDRRLKGEPLQYLINNAFFYGLRFKVNEGVLIPRPETEILVENTLKLIKDRRLKNPQILDVGTGCGNIAISLTKYLSSCKMLASDISKISLKIAKENAKRHNLESKITFLESNLFESLMDFRQKIDIIVSNPPYVGSCELGTLQREVRKEPLLALFGGDDGLYFYRRIIKEALLYLRSSGFLIMELAKDTSKKVKEMILSSTCYRDVKIIKDYNEIDRIIIAEKI